MTPSMYPRRGGMHREERPQPKNLAEFFKYLFGAVKSFLSRLYYIISLVWQTAPAILIAMVLLCILDGVLPVVGAYISKDLLNEISSLLLIRDTLGDVGKEIFSALRPLFFLFLLQFTYLFLRRIFERVNGMVTAIAGELVVNHIKLMIMEKAKEVDVSSFDRPAFYEKLENANREAGHRPLGILTSTFKVISAVISVASFIAVLATLSPLAPVVIVICALPGAFVTYFFKNKNYLYMRRHSKDRRIMNYFSNILVSKDHVREIKILGLGDTFSDRYKEVFKKYFKGIKSLMIRENVIRLLVSTLYTAANCALFAYVAYNVIYTGSMIGDYSLYTGALNSVTSYVNTLVASTATIYEGTLFIDNMMEFMKEKPSVVSSLPEPLIPQHGVPHTLELRGVSFHYPGSDRYILKDFNITFKSGQTTVLVGINGAGKTTLIRLITRLYDVTEGEILLDGRNIKEYSPKAYYDLFGIIFQDFGRYAVTASENIHFGDISREIDPAEISEAAEAGSAMEFLSVLPDGIDTPLTRVFEENGLELSGGQWQKISIARAFYKKSDILILDEPTAALDAIAEQEIYNKFEELAKGKISIFVSHRLSSAVTAGQIVVIDGGNVAEVGTHDELMANRKQYFRLFSTQAQRYGIEYEENGVN